MRITLAAQSVIQRQGTPPGNMLPTNLQGQLWPESQYWNAVQCTLGNYAPGSGMLGTALTNGQSTPCSATYLANSPLESGATYNFTGYHKGAAADRGFLFLFEDDGKGFCAVMGSAISSGLTNFSHTYTLPPYYLITFSFVAKGSGPALTVYLQSSKTMTPVTYTYPTQPPNASTARAYMFSLMKA